MNTYDIIEISSGNVVLSDSTYEECIEWLDNYGNIIEYTVIEHF
jgi:hypothetical protein